MIYSIISGLVLSNNSTIIYLFTPLLCNYSNFLQMLIIWTILAALSKLTSNDSLCNSSWLTSSGLFLRFYSNLDFGSFSNALIWGRLVCLGGACNTNGSQVSETLFSLICLKIISTSDLKALMFLWKAIESWFKF